MNTAHTEFEDLIALDAVGALDDQEILALHEHLNGCQQCQQAEREYQECATLFALALEPVQPPARIRSSLLRNISPSTPLTFVQPVERKRSWWAAAAAVFFLSLFAWSELRLRAAREELGQIAASRNALAEENARMSRSYETLSGQVKELSSPGNRTIQLLGQSAAPTAKAKVFLNEEKRAAIVFFQDLPLTAEDKEYELWVIRANAASADPAGTFRVQPDGTARVVMENLPVGTELKAIAVTLEPKGGLPAPSGAKYLVGSL